jgi:DNA repair exonuclease SbcCD ATPase subunit
VLDLQAKAYAVVAQYADDAERSNFGGKSTLLEAVDFALWGRHRHRTEDGFISRGESDCVVELLLDDGSRVARSRKRGKSTKLEYDPPTRGAAATRGEAQDMLAASLGIDSDDFLHRAYFQQRQMARFVLARPEERMGVVSAWLRLDKLALAEAHVRTKLAAIAHKREMVSARMAALVEDPHGILGGKGDLELVAQQERIEAELEEARGQFARLEEELDAYRVNKSLREKASEYEALVAEGQELRAEFDKRDLGALDAARKAVQTEERDAAIARAAARDVVSQRRLLARGEFDGTCPVAGIECPAKATINASSRQNALRLDEAQTVANAAEARYGASSTKERTATSAYQEALRLGERLDGLRQRAKVLKATHAAVAKLPPDKGDERIRQSISALRDRIPALSSQLTTIIQARSHLKTVQERRAVCAQELSVIDAELDVHRAALTILGRNGAQRRVAEGALAAIGNDANALLAECGVDLTVGLSWAREGQGLAKHCEQCGVPFPASAKAKACGSCGAERGPHLVQRLEVELSDRSGAAEDLAGIALQLAASSWLRASRGSAWGTLLLDEPVAQFDRAHRKRFSQHLGKMLAHAGVEQALVVAHDAAVLESLPGRILVTRDGGWSSARVVA